MRRTRGSRSPRRRPETAGRRGPRFTDETADETPQRFQDEAARLVNERGFDALSFRTLAEYRKVTRTAALYYFGTTVGLVAAVAAHGFDDLTSQLCRVRESGQSSEQAVRDLAIAYAKYALLNPRLYRAMHAPELWQAVTDLEKGRGRAHQEATDKANTWIRKAATSRLAAFEQFERAVETAEAAGRVKEKFKEGKDASARSAQLLTAIVDGFLFHHFTEKEGARKTTRNLLIDLEDLLDRALTGLYVTSP